MVENDWAKMLSDFQIQTDNLLMAKQPEIVLMDKQRNMAIVIDVVVSNDSNISRILSGLMEELRRTFCTLFMFGVVFCGSGTTLLSHARPSYHTASAVFSRWCGLLWLISIFMPFRILFSYHHSHRDKSWFHLSKFLKVFLELCWHFYSWGLGVACTLH